MGVTQPTEANADKKVRNFLHGGSRHTEAPSRKGTYDVSNFIAGTPHETSFDEEDAELEISYATRPLPVAQETPQPSGIEKIPAVIARVDNEEVILACTLPQATIEIVLPIDLVSKELAKYGTPVFVSVETINGFKTPTVVRRDVTCASADPFSDIDSWLQQS